jgi:hypothetical protein
MTNPWVAIPFVNRIEQFCDFIDSINSKKDLVLKELVPPGLMPQRWPTRLGRHSPSVRPQLRGKS